MNTKIFPLICICFVLVKANNRIGPEECNLDQILSNGVTQNQLKQSYEKGSGTGYWNILRGEQGHYITYMLENELKQICHCVATKVYSLKVEKSAVQAEYSYRYWREYIVCSWHVCNLSDATLKCSIPGTQKFYIVETEKFYFSRKTHDLFVLEVKEEDLKNTAITHIVGNLNYIKYSAGEFKALIPRVDLFGLA